MRKLRLILIRHPDPEVRDVQVLELAWRHGDKVRGLGMNIPDDSTPEDVAERLEEFASWIREDRADEQNHK